LIRCLTRQIAIHVGRDILFVVGVGRASRLPIAGMVTRGETTWQSPEQVLIIVIATRAGIERKHGNTKVAALRKEYGPSFAKGRRKDMMLKTLLKETGSNSLHEYLRHHHR